MTRAAAIFGVLMLVATPLAIAADTSGYRMPAVKIAVTDYKRSIDFYTRLGMKEGQKYNEREQQLTWADISQGSDIVLVLAGTGRTKLAPGGAFLVFFVPDMNATVKQLKDAGHAVVGEPRDMKTFMILITQDPDGNHVELAQPLAAAAK